MGMVGGFVEREGGLAMPSPSPRTTSTDPGSGAGVRRSIGAFTFTPTTLATSTSTARSPTSVCFGEGYFFFTTPGFCYASRHQRHGGQCPRRVRAEQRPEALIRGVFYNGELYLFGVSHTEVWASRGNPNPTGFPLNYVTSIWRGLVGTLAVTGFEEGFEGGPVLGRRR